MHRRFLPKVVGLVGLLISLAALSGGATTMLPYYLCRVVAIGYYYPLSAAWCNPHDKDKGIAQSHLIPRLPQLFLDPYVRPEVALFMEDHRMVIQEAAARHNVPVLSGMTDSEFATVIAVVLYNEHNGWVEDAIEPLRVFTPFYQQAQVVSNGSGVGSNFSVWPSNLRPSVALEILHQQVPVPPPTNIITVPLTVAGSQIAPADYPAQGKLYAAITQEITQDDLAIEYLAANLERGLYRAWYEGVPVSWQVLAAWHNQGIVRPEQIRANTCASDYIYRSAVYLDIAQELIGEEPSN